MCSAACAAPSFVRLRHASDPVVYLPHPTTSGVWRCRAGGTGAVAGGGYPSPMRSTHRFGPTAASLGLALALVAALSACGGGDGDGGGEEATDAPAQDEAAGSDPCEGFDRQAIEDALDAEIVDWGPSFGATTGGDMSASTLGCAYHLGSDDPQQSVSVSVLVDGEDEVDVAMWDDIEALADEADEEDVAAGDDVFGPPEAVDGVGDGAYRWQGDLFVLDGDRILVISTAAPDIDTAAVAEAALSS